MKTATIWIIGFAVVSGGMMLFNSSHRIFDALFAYSLGLAAGTLSLWVTR